MRKRIFTSTIAALALFAVVGLIAALAPSLAWPNLARAHSGDGYPHRADGDLGRDGADAHARRSDSAVYSYTVRVDNSVAQVTIAGTPDGDGTVTYEHTDADSGTDGHQVDVPDLGGNLIYVVVSHTVSGQFPPAFPTTQIYTVLVIREGTVATDRAALISLYNSTGGANWTNNTNWGSAEPLGDWYQVYVNTDGRVNALGLSQNNLRGTLPDALGNLDQMTWLYLWGNELRGSIPASLGSLTNLQELYLSANQLTGSIPDLSGLTNLQLLYMWGNQLSGSIPASMGSLTNLTVLSISANRLTGSIPDELGSLTNLTELYLSYNQLSGPIPTTLGSLTDLTILWLFENELSGGIPDSLGNLTNLEVLWLNQNLLEDSIPDSLGNLTSLQELYLYDNLLSGSLPDSLGDLTNLEVLYLSDNLLSGSLPASLGDLTNLGTLFLQYNQLTGADPELAGQPCQPDEPASS